MTIFHAVELHQSSELSRKEGEKEEKVIFYMKESYENEKFKENNMWREYQHCEWDLEDSQDEFVVLILPLSDWSRNRCCKTVFVASKKNLGLEIFSFCFFAMWKKRKFKFVLLAFG